MKTSDFDYPLPEELIAQYPAERRDESRLMVLQRAGRSIEHRRFRDIVSYLRRGDCLVVNETKVLPARIWARRDPTGGKVELLLLRARDEKSWEALVKPGRRTGLGARLIFDGGRMRGRVVERMDDGRRLIHFDGEMSVMDLMEMQGDVPLPPYVNRPPVEEDRERYQTVYAAMAGAVAAPTAGLHFTGELMERIRQEGIHIAPILLHVGLGTFRPVTTEDPRDYRMESEYYEIYPDTADLIGEVKAEGGRIIAVGTTTVKALETAVSGGKELVSARGWTDMFIRPPFTFKIVDCLLTNFHLPRSTLLMLVSALADRGFIMEAYAQAIERKYRFYSYGDAMLIL